MSIQSAKSFLERVRDDQDFANLFVNTLTVEERLALVKKSGYECSADELKEAIHNSELSEKDLEKIAAGSNQTSGDYSCPSCWWW